MSARSKLRILMTTDAVGGVWVYASELSRALCERGNEVMLVVMGPSPASNQLHSLQGVRGLQIRLTGLALEWMDPTGRDCDLAGKVLIGIADEFRPDVVHLNGFREGGLDWPAPVIVVAHSCVMTWWRACRGETPNEERWRVYARQVAAGLNAADAWVAPTAAFRDAIARTYMPSTEGRTIHNGLAVPAGKSAKASVILAAGRLWDEGKNIGALSAIAAELPWPVHVAGPAQEPAATRRMDEAVDGLTFLGALSRRAVCDAMRRAAIFVAPSLYEPFGLAVLEAAACGCALVLAELPSFRELWDGAALFVDPHDRAELRTALRTVCRDDAARIRLQTKATARAQRYSRERMVEAYRRLYCEMRTSAAAFTNCASSAPELPA